MDEEVNKRKVAGNLFQILSSDYLIRLNILNKNPKSEAERIISILDKGLSGRAKKCLEIWSSKQDIYIGFKVVDQVTTNNIVLGPYAELEAESKEFRDFWGSNCKIRRFLDGTIKETIEIENRSGPSYLILAIIEHLQSVHFAKVSMSASFFNLSPFIPSIYQTNDSLKEVRSTFTSLSRLLQDEASTDSLPIRKIRCVSSSLHFGGDLSRFNVPKNIQNAERKTKKMSNNMIANYFDLESMSTDIPKTIECIPIKLDITNKRHLSSELFSKLSLAYLIDLQRKLLKREKSIKSIIKGPELILAYNGFMWRIGVEEPTKAKNQSEGDMRSSIYEFFYNMSLRHNCWSSTVWAVRKWISSRFLDGAIPDVSLDIILSHIFLNPIGLLQAPASVESAFLRFLDYLSFTDFRTTPMILNYENCLSKEKLGIFDKNFTLERERLPPLCSFTLFDDQHFSLYTSKVNQKDLIRLTNYARQTLHSFLINDFVDLSSYERVCDKIDTSSYDILIHIDIYIPVAGSVKNEKQNSKHELIIPIVDFDPIQCYIGSLQASYGDIARFYFSKSYPHLIGVKLNKECLYKVSKSMMRPHGKRLKTENELVPNVDAMLDDLRIMGRGIVKEIDLVNVSI
uniref:Nucleolar protein 6 n=1 Tax=Lepeophtheirus salmonis TaxID=72036 RepID=A0A0K2U888_LEPSM